MNRPSELLRLVHPHSIPLGFELRVQIELQGTVLRADYEVQTPNPPHLQPGLPRNTSQWGLWESDVVELFLTISDECYYEFQLSPLGQFFELRIFEPRKRFDRSFHCAGARFSAEYPGAAMISEAPMGVGAPVFWKGRMEIPLNELGWDGDLKKLRGNVFAILGSSEKKTYWSLFLPKQAEPDFHRPEYFKPLLT